MDNLAQEYLVSSETETGAWKHKEVKVTPHEGNRLKITTPRVTVGGMDIDVRAVFHEGKLIAIELKRSK